MFYGINNEVFIFFAKKKFRKIKLFDIISERTLININNNISEYTDIFLIF